MSRFSPISVLLLVTLFIGACSEERPRGGTDATAQRDADLLDADTKDADDVGTIDASDLDAGNADAGDHDAQPNEDASADAGLRDGGDGGSIADGSRDTGIDASGMDAGMRDGSRDGGRDGGPFDFGVRDADIPDIAWPDGDIFDVSWPDLSIPDLSIPDIAWPDMGLPDATVPDTGPATDAGSTVDAGCQPNPSTPCETCSANACTVEYCACYADSQCVGLYSCLLGCNATLTCTLGCWSSWPNAGLPLVTCTNINCSSQCSWVDPCTDCLTTTKCHTVFGTCMANPDCIDLWSCFSGCGANDQNCIQSCMMTHSGGLMDLLAVQKCSSCSGVCAF